MKKILFIVAVATLFFVGCEKEKMFEPTNSIVLKAFTEPTTKASLNGEYATVWSADDKVGLVVTNSNGVNDWFTNQECTLTEGANTTTATFTSTTSYGETDQWNIAAFFPWNGTGSTANNWYGGDVYFKMPESYSEYTSGQSYLPLVADMSGGVSQPTEMRFKHVGAAVKVTINNLPAGAHSIGMTVDGEQVYGNFHISVSDAGTSAMVLDDSPVDTDKNTIWLNFAPANAERAFTFIFPVPALTTPKLSFQIYDKNDVLVWSKNLRAQTGSLDHADLLEMPATDITPYAKHKTVSTFGVRGSFSGIDQWGSAVYEMVTDGKSSIAKGITLAANDELKVTDGTIWSPDPNYKVTEPGTYDIIYIHESNTLKVVPTGECPYPGLPHLALVRQWGWYSSGSTLWTTNSTTVSITHPDNYGMARCVTMDDNYLYLPKSSGYANTATISISDPATQIQLPKSNITGGTIFKTSFARVIKNTDASVNGGKDVLLVCNLTESDSDANQLRVWAYKDGNSSEPTQIAGFGFDSINNVWDWRRYGDRFYVTGTYQDGKLYFPSFNNNKIVVLSIANGARTAVTQIAAGDTNSPNGIKDLTIYPGDNKLFITNGSVANLVAPTGNTVSSGWDEYTLSASSAKGIGTWGYNFFEFNGKNYIAYTRMTGNKAWFEVIEDNGDLLSSIEAQAGLLRAPIHSETDFDAEHATGGTADCSVRVIDGVPYIAALTRDGGLVVYKLVMQQ